MIAKETGYTHHYILWGESWLNLRLKLADAPGMKKVKTKPKKMQGSDLIKLLNRQ